jgi:hypothetical protein
MGRKEPNMNRAFDRIKRAWEENPLVVIAVGAMAVTAVSKLMDANTARHNSHVWQMEVNRRTMMKR